MVRNFLKKFKTIFQIYIFHYILVVTCVGGIVALAYLGYKYYKLKKYGQPNVITNDQGSLEVTENRRQQRTSYIEIASPVEEVSL